MTNNIILERLEGVKQRFIEVGDLLTQPDILSDMKKYVKLNKEYKDLQPVVAAYEKFRLALSNIESTKQLLATEKDDEMREMAKLELEELTSQLPEMEEEIKMLIIPTDPQDDKNAVMEIRAGTGGDEASIFAGDLFRMYCKYFESRGWKYDVNNLSEGTAGGYKEIVMNVTGDKVYGIMKYESGVHTVNTTYSAIRLTHIPSGIVVTCQDEKSQIKNYDKALKELRTRLYNLEYQKYLDEVSHKRKTMVSTGDRSAKIRTYNYPQGRMTDHRINLTIYNLPSIMDGNIQEVLDKLQMAENAERLKESNI
ncbi:MAG: peptide chain release factor 1 [Bacteroidia bacterium]|nr:peptide chain release factor 1 [Bacteroidia bacterium]